ncbi:MAG: polymer-forming cytoskeletal protein [Caldilineaceae bacterium]
MFRRSNRSTPDAIEVIIGPRASYNGVLRSDTSIRIDGVVESGLLQTAANVILTETARVNCEIQARTVSIRGNFNGVITADRVELLSGCHVSGALYVNSFLLDDGAILDGELHMQGAEDTPAPTQPSSTNTSIPVIPGPFGREQR